MNQFSTRTSLRMLYAGIAVMVAILLLQGFITAPTQAQVQTQTQTPVTTPTAPTGTTTDTDTTSTTSSTTGGVPTTPVSPTDPSCVTPPTTPTSPSSLGGLPGIAGLIGTTPASCPTSGGVGTTTPPGSGGGTTTPPGSGTGTTTPPGSGTGTTTPPTTGGGTGTTTPPSTGTGTTTATTTPSIESNSGGSSNGGGGGGSNRSSRNSRGYNDDSSEKPLGVSISCTVLLTTYIRQGQENDMSEVVKLQDFLNDHLGLAIPVTGIYESITEGAVNQFQLAHAGEVLAPWVPYGLESAETTTGYVYKTTQYKVNKIYCPSYDPGMPTLP